MDVSEQYIKMSEDWGLQNHGEMAEDVIDLKRVFKGIKKLFQWLFK